MPLPILAVVAARLGIKLATYMVRNQFKKGAAKKLRKVVTKKQAEIAKKKETSEKGYRGQGSKRKQEKVIQRKKKDKPKIDSGLSIKKKQTDKTKKVDKTKSYKVTPKSFKKKPMTQAEARKASLPKKGEYSDRAAKEKGINPQDRYDAPRQRLMPDRLPSKKGKTKILIKDKRTTHWSERYK